jgi:hypothetical protein
MRQRLPDLATGSRTQKRSIRRADKSVIVNAAKPKRRT